MKPHLSIIGSGSFATALVKAFSDNGSSNIHWWVKRPSLREEILENKHNPQYLSSVTISLDESQISSELNEIIEIGDWILLAVPAAFIKNELASLKPSQFEGKKIITVIKGMIPDSHQLIADYLHSDFLIPYSQIIVLTGPCHAEEIAQEKLSYLTLASLDKELSQDLGKMLRTPYIRTEFSLDIFGTEYASVLKNIMSLASGIFHGLGYGDNFQAVFISNAIQEMDRFLNQLYPLNRDIKDSAYLGDLLVTAYSQFSRNRTFGNMIGKGYSVKSAQLEMNMIAEGYYASASIQDIIEKNQLEMPILECVYRILYKGANPRKEMNKLHSFLH